MAIFFSDIHETHLNFLFQHSPDVLLSFARASIDYLLKGGNVRTYTSVAKKFNVGVEKIQNAVESFAYVIVECYKYNVNKNKLRDIFLNASFNEGQVEALVQFYDEQKATLEKLFTKSDIDSFFYDLEWRFEAKIASRALLNQITPVVTLNLKIADNSKAALAQNIRNNLLQSDPNTLIQVTNSLEEALQFSQSNAVRKIEKKIRKLVPE